MFNTFAELKASLCKCYKNLTAMYINPIKLTDLIKILQQTQLNFVIDLLMYSSLFKFLYHLIYNNFNMEKKTNFITCLYADYCALHITID